MKKIRQILPVLSMLVLSMGYQAVADHKIEGDTTKKKNKKEFSSPYAYENFGTRQRVTLYATMENNNVILAVQNMSDDSASVRIKAMYDCQDKGVPMPRKEVTKTVMVAPKTTIAYENDNSLMIITCDKQILKWNITSWSVDKSPVDKAPLMSEK